MLCFQTGKKKDGKNENTANDHVRPVIYIETEIIMHEDMAYLIAYVKNGEYKPYKDLAGNIWVKQSSDKRRVTENSEIRRLMQNQSRLPLPKTRYSTT